jgi:hypothetical protein
MMVMMIMIMMMVMMTMMRLDGGGWPGGEAVPAARAQAVGEETRQGHARDG